MGEQTSEQMEAEFARLEREEADESPTEKAMGPALAMEKRVKAATTTSLQAEMRHIKEACAVPPGAVGQPVGGDAVRQLVGDPELNVDAFFRKIAVAVCDEMERRGLVCADDRRHKQPSGLPAASCPQDWDDV